MRAATVSAIVSLAVLLPAATAEGYLGHIDRFGERGTGGGQLNSPTAIATGPGGDVYVLDSGGRVQRFDPEGRFVLSWGDTDPTPSSAPGQFNIPLDLTVDRSGNVYVADTDNRRIQKFSSSGQLLDPNWASVAAGGLAADGDDNIYAATGPIRKFSPTGELVASWNGGLNDLSVADDGEVFSTGVRQVWRFTASGRLLNRIPNSARGGTRQGRFAEQGPWGHALDDAGALWIADPYNHRIQKFARDGTFLSACRPDGDAGFPSDIARGRDGRLYVLEPASVQVLGEVSAPAVPCDDTAPIVLGLRLNRRRFRPAPRPSARRGAVLRFTLSERSRVRVTLQRGARRASGMAIAASAGRNAVRLTGWRGGRRLRAGLYRLSLRATDELGKRSRRASIRFRLLAR